MFRRLLTSRDPSVTPPGGPAGRPRRWHRLLALAVSATLALTISVVLAGPAYAAASLGLVKTGPSSPVTPGTSFNYTLVASCSSLTESCVNATITDVLPPEVEVTSLPTSNNQRTVDYNAATRTLTVRFIIELDEPNPPGSVGLPDGSPINVVLGVRVPADSPVTDGTVFGNTGTFTADNATLVTSTATVTVSVPRVVTPVATKSWSDGSAVAGSDEAGTISLGVRNGSSTSAEVTELIVEDSTPAVFERFNVTSVGPVTFPAGADQVTGLACTVVQSVCDDAAYGTGTPQSGPALSLPAEVDAADVTGLRFVFSSSAGTVLPVDPTGGTVQIGTVLRDTLRSGEQYSPTVREDIANCATPSAVDEVQGEVAAGQVCSTYSVQMR